MDGLNIEVCWDNPSDRDWDTDDSAQSQYQSIFFTYNKEQDNKEKKDQDQKEKDGKDKEKQDQKENEDKEKEKKQEQENKKQEEKDKKQNAKPNETKEQAIKNLDAINNDEQKVLLKVNRKKGDQKKKSKTKDW